MQSQTLAYYRVKLSTAIKCFTLLAICDILVVNLSYYILIILNLVPILKHNSRAMANTQAYYNMELVTFVQKCFGERPKNYWLAILLNQFIN